MRPWPFQSFTQHRDLVLELAVPGFVHRLRTPGAQHGSLGLRTFELLRELPDPRLGVRRHAFLGRRALRGLGQDPLPLFLGQPRLRANLIELSLL